MYLFNLFKLKKRLTLQTLILSKTIINISSLFTILNYKIKYKSVSNQNIIKPLRMFILFF